MRNHKIAGFCAVLLALLFAQSAAAETTYRIDPVHSTLQFKIRHLISNFVGKFDKIEGTIVHDSTDVSKSSVEVTIDVKSVDTDNENRNAHLRSPDFFNADSLYPTATFKSTSVTGTRDKFQVTGDLTLHGMTKQVTLDCEFLGTMDAGERMGFRAGFTGHAEIKRSDFNIGDEAAWKVVLGDDVELMLQIEAVKKKDE